MFFDFDFSEAHNEILIWISDLQSISVIICYQVLRAAYLLSMEIVFAFLAGAIWKH